MKPPVGFRLVYLFDLGRFNSDEWKDTHVMTIFKKGSKQSAVNYRIVSLTSQVCQVFQSITRDAIFNVFSPSQEMQLLSICTILI